MEALGFGTPLLNVKNVMKLLALKKHHPEANAFAKVGSSASRMRKEKLHAFHAAFRTVSLVFRLNLSRQHSPVKPVWEDFL